MTGRFQSRFDFPSAFSLAHWSIDNNFFVLKKNNHESFAGILDWSKSE
jgi:hypothetical protein